jgi:hypothetical protein
MAYIPKNKIKTNLHTSGGEFAYASTQEPYVGDYYELSTGKFFTGKTPNSANVKELVKMTDGEGGVLPPTSLPHSPLLPTPQDYKNGEFIRYFIVRKNQSFFIELDKATFDKYKQRNSTVSWRLYNPFSLFWVLTGDINQVAQTNKNVTELIEYQEQAFGLSLYLQENWTQYYKEKP